VVRLHWPSRRCTSQGRAAALVGEGEEDVLGEDRGGSGVVGVEDVEL
jgi:hypothetical protein